jgi:hypothetical protein
MGVTGEIVRFGIRQNRLGVSLYFDALRNNSAATKGRSDPIRNRVNFRFSVIFCYAMLTT